MRAKKIFFLFLYEVIVIGLFTAGFPLILSIFSNLVTALVFVGVAVGGCGFVIGMAFLSKMR